MSCDRHYGIETKPCSGNGLCANNHCNCNVNWISQGDYFPDTTFDCDISVIAVKLFSYVAIIFASVTIALAAWQLSKAGNLKWSDLFFKPTIGIVFWFSVGHMGNLIAAVARVIDPSKYFIGSKDWICSIGSMLFIFGCTAGYVSFVQLMVTFLSGYARMISPEIRDLIKSRVQIVATHNWKIMVFPFIYSVTAMISPALPKQGAALAIIGIVCMTCNITWLTASVLYVSELFVVEVGKYLLTVKVQSDEVDKIRMIHSRMSIANTCLKGFYAMAVPMCLIFCWPFLTRKNIYLQLLIRDMMCCVEFVVLTVFVNTNQGKAERGKTSRVQLAPSVRGKTPKVESTPTSATMTTGFTDLNVMEMGDVRDEDNGATEKWASRLDSGAKRATKYASVNGAVREFDLVDGSEDFEN